MVVLAGACGDLFFGVFFVVVPGAGTDWAAGHSAGGGISASGGAAFWGAGVLVCADAAVVFGFVHDAGGAVLGGAGGVAGGVFQLMAARVVRVVLGDFSFVHCGLAGFCGVPVGRDAARSRVYRAVFRAAGDSAGVGRGESRIARRNVFAAIGVVQDLLRVGAGENRVGGSHLAKFH